MAKLWNIMINHIESVPGSTQANCFLHIYETSRGYGPYRLHNGRHKEISLRINSFPEFERLITTPLYNKKDRNFSEYLRANISFYGYWNVNMQVYISVPK